MRPIFSLLLPALLASFLAGCATGPGPSPGGPLAGLEYRKYYGVRRPVENRMEMEVVRRVISTKAQRTVGTKRAKAFLATLTPADMEYLRSLGVTHICMAVPPVGRHEGAATVMMWDTQVQSFVGNEVFEVNNLPPDRAVLQMPDYTAICVLRYGA